MYVMYLSFIFFSLSAFFTHIYKKTFTGAKNTGEVIGLNCWEEFGGCPSCFSDTNDGCAIGLSEISKEWTLCGRPDVNHRRTFDGEISCLRTWERALSVSEIADLYNSERDPQSCGSSSQNDSVLVDTTTEKTLTTTTSSPEIVTTMKSNEDEYTTTSNVATTITTTDKDNSNIFNQALNEFHEHFWYVVVILCLCLILMYRICMKKKSSSNAVMYLQQRHPNKENQDRSGENSPLLKRQSSRGFLNKTTTTPVVVDGFVMKKDKNNSNIEMTTSAVVVPEGFVVGTTLKTLHE
jgi:hypothetical protein